MCSAEPCLRSTKNASEGALPESKVGVPFLMGANFGVVWSESGRPKFIPGCNDLSLNTYPIKGRLFQI